MKKMSRLLAILLTLTLMIPSFIIAGFATEKDESLAHYANGTGYLAFGDSVTRGYALPNWDEEGYTIDNLDDPNCRIVHGSYPFIIAETLGCSVPTDMTDKSATYWPIAQDALTTSFILDLLGVDDEYYDEIYLHNYISMQKRYLADLYYFGTRGESFSDDGVTRYDKDPEALSVRELVENSSLITIEIGMSDILNRARSLATDSFFEAGGDFSDTKAVIQILKDFVARMYEGYTRWEKNFPMILDFFKENINDDATVVIIGAFNPIYDMTVTEDIPVPVGTAMSVITNLMNQKYRKWAQEYGFIFVDVSNVETGAAVNTISVVDFLSAEARDQGIATHPTEEGYQQIARMVLNALREKDAKQKTKKTTIKVDLGEISQQKINYVAINGIKLPKNSYSIQDYVLTIPNILLPANRLTVSAVDVDGKVYYSRYDLDYNLCAGYVATRIYSTTDAARIFKR